MLETDEEIVKTKNTVRNKLTLEMKPYLIERRVESLEGKKLHGVFHGRKRRNNF